MDDSSNSEQTLILRLFTPQKQTSDVDEILVHMALYLRLSRTSDVGVFQRHMSNDVVGALGSWSLLPSKMLFCVCVADIQEGDSKAQLWITVKSFIQ